MVIFPTRELLLLLIIVNSAVTLICYECNGPEAYGPDHLKMQAFPFVVTKENIPTLENCTAIHEEESKKGCAIVIQWEYNTTEIGVGLDDFRRPPGFNENIIYFMRIEMRTTVHALGYECHMDYCNNPSKLKLLLESSRVEVDRDSIVSLLTADESTSSVTQSCYKNFNYTKPIRIFDRSCDASNDSDVCTTCTTLMVMNRSNTEMCSGCAHFTSGYYGFENIVIYDIQNPVWFKQEYFQIYCYNTTDCNDFDNIQRIQKFYTMEFDLTRFFGITTTTTPSEITTTASAGIILLPIINLIFFTIVLSIERFHN